MKQLLFLVIAISVTTLLRAQEPLSKSQQEVQQTVIQLFDALSNRDSVGLKLYCTDDIEIYETGAVWNLDTLVGIAIALKNVIDFKRVNTFDFINTAVNKNTAWATYNLHSVINGNGKQRVMQWMETVVLVREKKTWKIKLLHSTLIKRT